MGVLRASRSSVVAFTLSACSVPLPPGDAAIEPDGGIATVDVAAFCAAQVEGFCLAAETCGCLAVQVADCVAAQQRACEAALAYRAEQVALGVATFDEGIARDCVDATRASAERCEPPASLEEDFRWCSEAFVARFPVGASCWAYQRGSFCAGGAGVCAPSAMSEFCFPLPQEGMLCLVGRCAEGLSCDAFRCVAAAAAGNPCDSPSGCAAGLTCGLGGTCAPPGALDAPCDETAACAAGLACVAGRCAPGPPAGTPCDTEEPAPCAAGDVCLPSEPRFTCLPRAAEGERCSGRYGRYDCADGLECDVGASWTCRALSAIGMPCSTHQCAAGAGCNADGICEALPAEGEPCLDGGPPTCAAGLGCASSGRCAPGAAEGMPCTGGVCAAGLVCEFFGELPTCVLPGSIGDRCASNRDCGAALYCDGGDGRCAATLEDGAPCLSDGACRPGSGCLGDGAPGVCQPLPAEVGAPCEFSYELRCGGGLRCAVSPGACAPGACAFVR